MANIKVTSTLEGMYLISCDNNLYEVPGEEFQMLHNGRAVIVRHGDEWTLFASTYTRFGDYPFGYKGVYKLFEGILEYKSIEDAFAFRTNDGWFFIFFSNLWEIENEEIRQRTIKNALRLGNNLTSLTMCGGYKNYPRFDDHDEFQYGYVVEVDNEKFLMYGGSGYYERLKFHKYVILKGYTNIAKVYLRPNTKKFVIAALATGGTPSYSVECTKCTDNGDGGLILQDDNRTAFYVISEHQMCINSVVLMGEHTIKVYPCKYKNLFVVSVDGGEKKVYDDIGAGRRGYSAEECITA